MTFVRVSGSGEENAPEENNVEPPAPAVPDPILQILDQEQINRLENVLRSDEAKDFLGEVMSNNSGNNDIGEFLNPSEVQFQPEQESDKSKANKRRSQRQIDKELKEEAERIRKENQEIMKKERDDMRRASGEEIPEPPVKTPEPKTPATTPSGR